MSLSTELIVAAVGIVQLALGFWLGCMYRNREPERRYERRAAKRYHHAVASWRPCWHTYHRPCLRCAWREITGRNRRDKAAELLRIRTLVADLPPTDRAALRRHLTN